MLPTSLSPTSSAFKPVPQPDLSTGLGPPLPAPDTVDTLHILSGRKSIRPEPGTVQPTSPEINPQDQMAQICRSGLAPERLFRMTRDLGMALGGPSMSAENRTVLMTQIADAHLICDGSQMEMMASGLAAALGNQSMTAEHRDGLVSAIVDMPASVGEDRAVWMLDAMGVALGGPAMTTESRDVLIARVLGSYATNRSSRMSNMIQSIGNALGGVNITMENRHILMTQIVRSHLTCSADQLWGMICGLHHCLRNKNMTVEYRDTLMQLIMATFATSSPEKMGGMIRGLAESFCGNFMRNMDPENLNWIVKQILESQLTCSVAQICHMVTGLAQGLGGHQITHTSCRALITQVLQSPSMFKEKLIVSLLRGMGECFITSENLGTLMSQFLAAHASFGDQIVNNTCRSLFNSVARYMSADKRKVIIANILAAPQDCSAALVTKLMVELTLAINIRTLPTADQNAIMAQILATHATTSPARMRGLFELLCQVIAPRALLEGILSCGAGPFKTGTMIGLALRAKHADPERRQEYLGILNELATSNETALRYKPFIDAARLAHSGDIGGIVTLNGLDDGQKLNFVSFSCSMTPLDKTSLPAEVGKILFVDVPDSLKAQTLSTLLSKGPGNPAIFATVRQWLIGTLSDLPKINWKKTKQGMELEGDSAAFAVWYTNIHALYHEYSEHMNAEFIAREKSIITRHPLLPAYVKENLLATLTKREQTLSLI